MNRKEQAESILKSAGIKRTGPVPGGAWKKRVAAINTDNLMRLPRKGTDLRIRNWSPEEKAVAIKAYKAGRSRNYIRSLIGCSIAPITRMLQEEGILKPQHFPKI